MTKTAYYLLIVPCFLVFACNTKPKTTSNTADKKTDTIIAGSPSFNPYSQVDVSPMDMSYFPVDYPKLKMTNSITSPPVARVIYSRPHKGGRVIFGGLQKYGQAWRLGANEATELELFQTVTIMNKKINAGRYLLYCIPYQDKWTIVLNNNIYTWGLKIDSTKDLTRFDIPIKTVDKTVEYFTMVFQQAGTGAELVMAWDTIEARLPFSF